MAFSSLIATAISACGEGTAENTITTEPSSLDSRIITTITDTEGQAWLCGQGTNVLAAYLFFPAGQFTGLNPVHQLGMEIDHTKIPIRLCTFRALFFSLRCHSPLDSGISRL